MYPVSVSVENAALMLGVSKPTVYDLIKQNELRPFKCGTRTLISVEEIREYVKRQTEKGA